VINSLLNNIPSIEIPIFIFFLAYTISAILLNFRGKWPGNKTAEIIFHPAAFILFLGIILFVFRIPILFYPDELNVDESSMLAQAVKYLEDPIPWRSIDGSSSGPLNAYVLLIPLLLGGDLNYFFARIVGLFCVWGTVSFTYLSLRKLFGYKVAIASSFLPLGGFYLFSTIDEFVHYTSEHLPILLISAGIYVAVLLSTSQRQRIIYAVISGIVLGAVPFAKNQAAPLAVAAAVFILFVLYVRKKEDAMPSWKYFTAFAVSFFSVPFVIMAMVLWGGVLEDFWYSYIFFAVVFSSKPQSLKEFFNLMIAMADMRYFLVGCFLLFLLGNILIVMFKGFKKTFFVTCTITLIYLFISIYIIHKPGRPMYHYSLFIIHPLTLLLGVYLGNIINIIEARRLNVSSLSVSVVLLGFILMVILSQVYGAFHSPKGDPFKRKAFFASITTEKIQNKRQWPGEGIISKYAKAGEKLAVWGWDPSIYLKTGMVPATRDTIIWQQFVENDTLQRYYKERFLKDLSVSEPPVFIDIIRNFKGSSLSKYSSSLKSFKELKNYIEKHYVPVALLYDEKLDNKVFCGRTQIIVIYVLKERIKDKQPHAFMMRRFSFHEV
jgi:hypothetical protein